MGDEEQPRTTIESRFEFPKDLTPDQMWDELVFWRNFFLDNYGPISLGFNEKYQDPAAEAALAFVLVGVELKNWPYDEDSLTKFRRLFLHAPEHFKTLLVNVDECFVEHIAQRKETELRRKAAYSKP